VVNIREESDSFIGTLHILKKLWFRIDKDNLTDVRNIAFRFGTGGVVTHTYLLKDFSGPLIECTEGFTMIPIFSFDNAPCNGLDMNESEHLERRVWFDNLDSEVLDDCSIVAEFLID
jgi:hypothetical protein